MYASSLSVTMFLASLAGTVIANPSPTIEARAACNADACARAITGTAAKPAATVRKLDCVAFQETVITTFSGGSRSTATRTSFPAYVSSGGCGNVQFYDTSSYYPYVSSRYASACSCFGATKTAVTVPASPTCTDNPNYRDSCGNKYPKTCFVALTGTVIGSANYGAGYPEPDFQCFFECTNFGNNACVAISYNYVTGVCNYIGAGFSSQPDPNSISFGPVAVPKLDCSD